jgi:hypothetical protein
MAYFSFSSFFLRLSPSHGLSVTIRVDDLGMLYFTPQGLSSCYNSRLYTLVRRKLAYSFSLLFYKLRIFWGHEHLQNNTTISLSSDKTYVDIDNITFKVTVFTTVMPSNLPQEIIFPA